MSLSLGIAIVLFILLFFTPKEGFYSDNNVTMAIDDLKAIHKKLDTVKKTVDELTLTDLTAIDSVSSVNKILQTTNNALYTSGVVSNLQGIKEELALYQTNVRLLNDFLATMPKSVVLTQYDELDKTKKLSVSLSYAIERLSEQANKISGKLNQIPDS